MGVTLNEVYYKEGYDIEMSYLSDLVESAVIFKQAIVLDCAVYVCDTNGIIQAYIPSDYMKERGLISRVGDKMPQSSPAIKCLETGKPCTAILPASDLGISVKSHAHPVFDNNGQLIGVLGTSISMDIQNTLQSAAQNVASVAEEVSASTEELGATAENLAQVLARVKTAGEKVLKQIGHTDDILQFVSNIAVKSNLLGINAAIEAARSGEHGRGFSVVADEIRKMAEYSANSVNQIKKILNDISKETEDVVDTIIRASGISEQQSAATEEIAATIQSLASAASDVEKIIERL